ncbi:ovochymase-2-like isoform X2 [Chironomus tepperi]
MQITRGVENGVFYCLTYEKTTGNVYGFDSLTIELHPDYDLQYSGANVIDYEFPSFKLYDVRVTEEYKGRFAIYSNNTSFKIYQVTINNEPQNCTYGKGKNRHIWPEQRTLIDVEEHTTLMNIIKTSTSLHNLSTDNLRTTVSKTNMEHSTFILSTTIEKFTTSILSALTTEIPSSTEIQGDHDYTTETVPYTTTSYIDENNYDDKCGKSLILLDFKRFQIPYNPGEFPFAVSIFQILNLNEHHYKCAGTIVSSKLILTSVNCLLDHNSKLLSKEKLIVYTSQYSLLFKKPTENSKIYNIEKIFLHENYNYNLDNNIAAIKVERSIEFDEFVQPACLPDLNLKLKVNDVMKLVGFGKSKILTESNFHLKSDDVCEEAFYACQTFTANSKTIEYTDYGCGLYVIDERSRWKLIGITSIIPNNLDNNTDVIFTNIVFFIDWLEKIN